MTTVLLNVPDISCEHCARTIRRALAPIEGIDDLAVDIPAKQVRVTYDASVVAPERMIEILRTEGYPVAP
ncbi:MAG TPA: heavy-metal-associated domain-containing protein [bacterium]|nr:heavy-metal-associated domain-containing protein [bacterium]